MLNIIVLILKVIGIVLALLLILLMLVLFVPIRYKGQLDYFDSGNGWIKLHWLLHSISVKLIIEQNYPRFIIKIFGFSLHKKKKEIDPMTSDFADIEKMNNESENLEEENHSFEQPKEALIIDQEQCLEPTELDQEEEKKEEQADKLENKETGNEEKRSPLQKIMQAIQNFWMKLSDMHTKIRSFWQNTKRKITVTVKKITSSKTKMDEIKEILLEDNSRQVYTFLKSRLIRVIRHIRPRKFQLYLHYGSEDPALTGKITGWMAAMMVFYENAIFFEPDFEKAVIEGSLKFQGRVQIFVFLWTGIRILLKKQVRVMIKKLLGKIRK